MWQRGLLLYLLYLMAGYSIYSKTIKGKNFFLQLFYLTFWLLIGFVAITQRPERKNMSIYIGKKH